MSDVFRTLAIESSCDDTAVAILENSRKVLSSVMSSQIDRHALYGGVVPEFASRMHLEAIIPLVKCALREADIKDPASDLDLIAVTAGPGLMGSLLVGVMAAKGLSQAWGIPLLGVNHLEGHLFANVVNHPDLEPPFLSMIVSGGHTEVILVKDFGDYEFLGGTRDDAAGEAFDKVAKLIGLTYPGGPVIDRLSNEGNPKAFNFPVPLRHSDQVEFSFSGLKTAVLWQVEKLKKAGETIPVPDVCASFQLAVVKSLILKLELAVKKTGIDKVALSGGVAANSALRNAVSESKKMKAYFPDLDYCTDNAVMIGGAGYSGYQRGKRSDLSLSPNPSLKL